MLATDKTSVGAQYCGVSTGAGRNPVAIYVAFEYFLSNLSYRYRASSVYVRPFRLPRVSNAFVADLKFLIVVYVFVAGL